MDYKSLEQKILTYDKKFNVKVIGKTNFNRNIYAVEKIVDKNFATAIFFAGIHGREHITCDLLCKMLDENLFDEIKDFNLSFVLMANPDGVELSCHGLESVSENSKKILQKINGESLDFSMWKANGLGVDLNNNFDANFGTNVHSKTPASSGYVGKFAESELETKAIVKYTMQIKPFFTVSYHSKGEEIYFNFFQTGKDLKRDRLIAKRFAFSTGYKIRNVEKVSSGGYKDFCVQKLRIPALTIEVGNDNLSHPIQPKYLPEIFERHKQVAKDVKFAYNVFRNYQGKWNMAYNEKFMKKAIALAKKAYDFDEVPVGAVIVKDDKIVSFAYNKRETSKDATAHAEILAIKKACKKLDDFRLLGCEMYVSLEPCVMCTGAILNSRIERVYFGAHITNGSISAQEITNKSELNHKTEFVGGFFEEECSNLVSGYFKQKRK